MSSSDLSVRISLARARKIATAACLHAGASLATAESLVNATLSAARFGSRAMGFPHLMDYLAALREGRIVGDAEPQLTHPLATIFRGDARGGIAQLGFDRAFDQICAVTRMSGTCIFTQKNSYTAGELGYYVRRLAGENLIGIAVANGPALMAAAPGGTRTYCTNPLAFGAPLGDGRRPFVIDQASSASAFVKVAQAARDNEPIPEGWAVDESGHPTTDAAAAVRGALLPFGGYKGANMALLVEILAAGLSAASWSTDAPAFDQGSASPAAGLTVIALSPIDEDFVPRLSAQLQHLQDLGVSIPSQRARPADVDEEIELSPALLARLQTHAHA